LHVIKSQSKQKLKTYLIINIFVNANKTSQAIKKKKRKKRCVCAQTKRAKKIISINIAIFINFTYSKFSLKHRLYN